MADTWTAGVDRAVGYVVTSPNWNELLGADGSLNFLGTTHDHSGDAGDGATVLPCLFMQSVAADDGTANAAYEDFAGLTMSIVLAVKSNVLVILTVGDVANGTLLTTDSIIIYWGAGTEATTEARFYHFDDAAMLGNPATSILKTGIAAGTYTCKAQIKTSGGAATFTNAVLSAIVMPVA
jgi:hypothetical protein